MFGPQTILFTLECNHILIRAHLSGVMLKHADQTAYFTILKSSYFYLTWSSLHLLSLLATYVSGHLNLSRPYLQGWLSGDRMVAPPLGGEIYMGLVWQIDLFSSRRNMHCLLFFSLMDCRWIAQVDKMNLVHISSTRYAPLTLERVPREGLGLILWAP